MLSDCDALKFDSQDAGSLNAQRHEIARHWLPDDPAIRFAVVLTLLSIAIDNIIALMDFFWPSLLRIGAQVGWLLLLKSFGVAFCVCCGGTFSRKLKWSKAGIIGVLALFAPVATLLTTFAESAGIIQWLVRTTIG